ncbi:MAG: N-acetylmuramoyl-L-alanine amidase [Christensenellaceae bacterium]|jgi:N-acetylmuramoyl-L-alanine amidase|nr:N-acetylmuramoyl-L-alanine amidase [Christensenellaceae bacterium]
MFLTIKRRHIIIASVCALVFCAAIFAFTFKQTEFVIDMPKDEILVVVDAGHGGIDGGSVGRSTGIKESELTLSYALNLMRQLNALGINVVLTRNSEMGLYNPKASNLKKSDMRKRKQIIEESAPNMVVSIHMNSFALQSSRGAQVFYKNKNECGKQLAEDIQRQFINSLPYARSTAKVGDYFMVNCTDLPAVIVECGFLSNSQEEKLLVSRDYQDKVCYSIVCGILDFLDTGKNSE